MSEAPVDPLLGALIDGRYRIERLVGAGGFGAVYKALHVALGAPVAVKVLALDERRDPDLLARRTGALLEEARTLKRLRHPNIAAALDVGLLPDDDGGARLPYLVMAWCEGPTLKEVLDGRRGKPMSLGQAWRLFEPLLDAVAHAHGEGVVHRDLKPGNVILEVQDDGSWRPRVIDFGIAKLVSPDDTAGSGETRTASGSSAFTPRYAAPEQVAGARTGPWTDVHALGLVFVELVTGASAIDVDDESGLGAVDPVRPTPSARGVDVGALEPILARALALRPVDRYADAALFAAAMREAAAGGSSRSSRPPDQRPSPVPAERPGFATDGTAPPSSHTLGTQSRDRSTAPPEAVASAPPLLPPVSRVRHRLARRVATMFGLLALVIAAAVGARSPLKRAARAVFPRALRDVSVEDLDARADRLPLGACRRSVAPGTSTFGCTDGTVIVIDLSMWALDPEDGRAMVNNFALSNDVRGVAFYAIDGKRGVIVAAPASQADAALDAMLDGDTVEVRAKAEPLVAPAMSASAKQRLSAWTAADLWAAGAAASERVVAVYAHTDPALIGVQQGDNVNMLSLHVHFGQQTLDGLKRSVPGMGSRMGFAIQGGTLLLVAGAPRSITTDFVKKLVGEASYDEIGIIEPAKP